MNSFQTLIQEKSQKILLTSRNLKSPMTILKEQSQSLDSLEIRLSQIIKSLIAATKQDLKIASASLNQSNALRMVMKYQTLVNEHIQSMHFQIKNALVQKKFVLKNLSTNLNAVSPLAVLDRGYAIVVDDSGKALTSSSNINVGETIHTRLANGNLTSNVTKKK
jgi:exodeoxyribonuclease VII large subunit